MIRITPIDLDKLENRISRISNEDKRRLSSLRKQEILGALSLAARRIDSYISRILNLHSGKLSEELESTKLSPNTALWKHYNRISALSASIHTEIASYTYWVSNLNEASPSVSLPAYNNLSGRIEIRVLEKGKNNPYYTHIEAIVELAEEEGIELSSIRSVLSKSILQKIEAIGLSRKQLKGSSASLPI